ncbi:Fatty acid oxidation complex subunit alpha [Thalassovita mediterranea]|uniref:Fatty acid oxidation complex subunit alpha n=1 Tax=Thalassovita mediterranea TaxID=340021 RepID=A0A0P1GQK9_9RHOB|nr:3-hydroxyacyl-CoA dehydrogenase NAD-binding domain-containing protein [Thalassovita mediterranea]CUH84786.1 Fatty acid oxidation complex subunit alpha [Thalassovita mediterranea]SIS35558.1 short chain enoyl-CoA hydratase /3-hydroxyacyl-CoA dehydrogenase [Thalassovita mediterranea]
MQSAVKQGKQNVFVQKSTDKTATIGMICLDAPPVNALSGDKGIPQAIAAAVQEFDADPAIKAIAIYAAGRFYSAGADIAEFRGNPATDAAPLRSLFEALDASQTPVVLAMHGVAFGGGLEVALAAHYRIAEAKTKLGLPEVSLGLLPGGGGTQRLPRLIAMDKAVEMIITGRPVSAAQALENGLVDALFDGDARAAVLDFATKIINENKPVRRSRDQEIAAFDPAIFDTTATKLAKTAHRNPGPMKALDCLREAAQGPFERSLTFEHRAFDALMEHPQTKGICHAFLGERTAVKIPGLEGQKTSRSMDSVAIIGAGTMGVGIALACMKAGLQTLLLDLKDEALERARANVERQLAGQVKKGRLSQDRADAQLALLTLSTSFADMGDADVIIEAVFEDLGVKESVFRQIDAIAKPGALLASNTSTLDVNLIAAFTNRPQDVVGLHFFSPANIMRLLEIIRADDTSADTLLASAEFARKIGKVGVVVGVCDGFVGNRIFEEYLRQAYLLLEEGATPEDIDGAMEQWGWAMGALKVMDLAGQDIGWAIRKRRKVEQPDRPYSTFPDQICELGWYGQKTGRGYYNYPEGVRGGATNPDVLPMLQAHSIALGLIRRTVTAEEVVERTLLAMINEGAKILEEGIAYRPVDIDVIYLNGYGFGRDRGGPMFQADLMGLKTVLARLEELSKGREGWALKPAAILYRMQEQGLSFADLNAGKTVQTDMQEELV